MIQKINIFYFFVLFIAFSGCKKYSEDPFISLRTVKGRFSGTWKISWIKINDLDATALYLDSLNLNSFDDVTLKIQYNDENNQDKIFHQTNLQDYFYTNYFSFYEKKKYISFDAGNGFDESITKILDNLYTRSSWKILRLYKGQFHIEKIHKNTKYELFFIKK